MNTVLERLPIAIGTPSAAAEPAMATALEARPGTMGNIARDRIKQVTNPNLRTPEQDSQSGNGFTNMFPGGAWGIVQQLIAIIQQLVSMWELGNASSSTSYFRNATASSTGDPHLAFSGTGVAGNTSQTHFESMVDHANLLDSDSFSGGYQISTKTTQPDANGITYNQQATISTNYGRTQVTLDKTGGAYVTQDGQQYTIANGHSYDFGNGETATRNNDGSLVVTDTTAAGASITTALSQNGNGVDVNIQAHNVGLGGDLLDH